MSKTTSFRVEYPVTDLVDNGCNHSLEDVYNFEPGCRPCSINRSAQESGFQVKMENTFYTRIYYGFAETRDQRITLARFLAFVQGHPEPLDLAGADKALEKLK